jgi:UDP-N-acetyl-D-glucosamine dehydrogenase
MARLDELEDRITRHDYTVGIVGAGYAGLPLALTFAEAGFPVIVFDVDAAKSRAAQRRLDVHPLDLCRADRGAGQAGAAD